MEATTASGALPRTVDEIRADFPILAREINGKPLVYVDNAATSQKPASVIEAIDSYYRNSNANIHRSMHQLAAEATESYEGGRVKVASFIGATDPSEIVFVRNATEAINLVRYTWAREQIGSSDVVVLTEMEHHSNIVPWQQLCQERGAQLAYLTVDGEGKLDLDQLDAVLAGGRVRLVTVTHISNVLGTVNPVSEIARRAHEAGAKVLIDGAQAAPQIPLEVVTTEADFYAFTGHKMLGPTGIGVLWARLELLESMPPFMTGGSMIDKVESEYSTWAPPPARFEAGTPAIAEAAGLGAAVDYLSALGMRGVRSHERDLTAYALDRLADVPKLKVHGPRSADERGSLVSFEIAGVHPHDISEICNREAVCIRAGHHCAQPLMRRLGVAATARASFSVYNTRDDVDRLVEALEKTKSVFGI
ncbi:MAG: cysteine desulfurase [Solirubrobacterales bacterium]